MGEGRKINRTARDRIGLAFQSLRAEVDLCAGKRGNEFLRIRELLRDAKIGDLQSAVQIDQDVIRLEIAMSDLQIMVQVEYSFENLAGHGAQYWLRDEAWSAAGEAVFLEVIYHVL